MALRDITNKKSTTGNSGRRTRAATKNSLAIDKENVHSGLTEKFQTTKKSSLSIASSTPYDIRSRLRSSNSSIAETAGTPTSNDSNSSLLIRPKIFKVRSNCALLNLSRESSSSTISNISSSSSQFKPPDVPFKRKRKLDKSDAVLLDISIAPSDNELKDVSVASSQSSVVQPPAMFRKRKKIGNSFLDVSRADTSTEDKQSFSDTSSIVPSRVFKKKKNCKRALESTLGDLSMALSESIDDAIASFESHQSSSMDIKKVFRKIRNKSKCSDLRSVGDISMMSSDISQVGNKSDLSAALGDEDSAASHRSSQESDKTLRESPTAEIIGDDTLRSFSIEMETDQFADGSKILSFTEGCFKTPQVSNSNRLSSDFMELEKDETGNQNERHSYKAVCSITASSLDIFRDVPEMSNFNVVPTCLLPLSKRSTDLETAMEKEETIQVLSNRPDNELNASVESSHSFVAEPRGPFKKNQKVDNTFSNVTRAETTGEDDESLMQTSPIIRQKVFKKKKGHNMLTNSIGNISIAASLDSIHAPEIADTSCNGNQSLATIKIKPFGKNNKMKGNQSIADVSMASSQISQVSNEPEHSLEPDSDAANTFLDSSHVSDKSLIERKGFRRDRQANAVEERSIADVSIAPSHDDEPDHSLISNGNATDNLLESSQLKLRSSSTPLPAETLDSSQASHRQLRSSNKKKIFGKKTNPTNYGVQNSIAEISMASSCASENTDQAEASITLHSDATATSHESSHVSDKTLTPSMKEMTDDVSKEEEIENDETSHVSQCNKAEQTLTSEATTDTSHESSHASEKSLLTTTADITDVCDSKTTPSFIIELENEGCVDEDESRSCREECLSEDISVAVFDVKSSALPISQELSPLIKNKFSEVNDVQKPHTSPLLIHSFINESIPNQTVLHHQSIGFCTTDLFSSNPYLQNIYNKAVKLADVKYKMQAMQLPPLPDSPHQKITKNPAIKKNNPRIKKYKPDYWANKRLYDFLEKKLAPVHKLNRVLKAEEIVKQLHETYQKLKESQVHEAALIEALKIHMAQENIVATTEDFYKFVDIYMPRDFCDKIVPCLQPFTGIVWPPVVGFKSQKDPILD